MSSIISDEKRSLDFKEKLPKDIKLISKNEYRKVLREYLPDACFKTDTKHLLHYIFFMILYLTGIFCLVSLQTFYIKFFISALMGVCLASLTFFLHDLFHGSIVKSKPISYLTGLSIGIFNLFAPLFWHRVHNFHHARTGNIDDPDRSYILAEAPKNLIEKFAYKTRLSNESYHPFLSLILMSTGFFWYFLNTISYGLVRRKTSIKEDKKYQRIQELFKTPQDRLVVLSELFIILSFQIFLFTVIAKANFLNYFLISLMPAGIAHFITMMYIHTNHFLSPLTGEIDDPLVNSLSIRDNKFVDLIFSNFSHHVEHHLFPAMSSAHYPKVRKLLLKLYPDRFQLVTMAEAVKMLSSTPRIYADYTHLVTLDGKKTKLCLMPAKAE